MTTLVTGAGVIGCHTARLLAQRGESVLLADVAPALAAIATIVDDPRVRIEVADVTDFARLTRLVESHGVRRIVHTAALLSTAIRQDPVKGVEVNVMGTAHLLEIARLHRLERVVIASSTTVGYPVFGDFEGDSLPEDFSLKSIRHRPGSIYVATKVAAEHLALLYRDLYGVNTVSLRYAAVISAWSGPGTSVPARVLSSPPGARSPSSTTPTSSGREGRNSSTRATARMPTSRPWMPKIRRRASTTSAWAGCTASRTSWPACAAATPPCGWTCGSRRKAALPALHMCAGPPPTSPPRRAS